MAAEDLIVGLDIGTTKVCVVIGQYGESGQLEIVGVGTTPSRGLRRGVVINIETTVRSIANAVEAAEMMSGREVHSVYTGIAGGHIEGINSRGVVAVTGKGREISREDVDRVIDAAKAIVIPMDREVLHVIPQEFIVDAQGGIKNPIGMVGVRLEAEVHIITGAVSSAQNIVKCVNRAGFKVNDIALEPLASSKAVLSQDEKELGVLLIDLGGGTTDVLVHLEGAPYHTEVLSVGGDQVTNDLSIMLKTPLETAEKIKKEAGCCYAALVQEQEEVRVPGVGGRPPRTVRAGGVGRDHPAAHGRDPGHGPGADPAQGLPGPAGRGGGADRRRIPARGDLRAGRGDLQPAGPHRLPRQAGRPGGGVLQPGFRHRGGTGALRGGQAGDGLRGHQLQREHLFQRVGPDAQLVQGIF